jgi:hypothetical protein
MGTKKPAKKNAVNGKIEIHQWTAGDYDDTKRTKKKAGETGSSVRVIEGFSSAKKAEGGKALTAIGTARGRTIHAGALSTITSPGGDADRHLFASAYDKEVHTYPASYGRKVAAKKAGGAKVSAKAAGSGRKKKSVKKGLR